MSFFAEFGREVLAKGGNGRLGQGLPPVCIVVILVVRQVDPVQSGLGNMRTPVIGVLADSRVEVAEAVK